MIFKYLLLTVITLTPMVAADDSSSLVFSSTLDWHAALSVDSGFDNFSIVQDDDDEKLTKAVEQTATFTVKFTEATTLTVSDEIDGAGEETYYLGKGEDSVQVDLSVGDLTQLDSAAMTAGVIALIGPEGLCTGDTSKIALNLAHAGGETYFAKRAGDDYASTLYFKLTETDA
jgi:hypothetical protein